MYRNAHRVESGRPHAGAVFRVLFFLLMLTGAAVSAQPASDWRIGITSESVTHVYTKDPGGDLNDKTHYLGKETLGLVGTVDQEELKCPKYFIIRFLSPAVYEVSLTCRTDGNHQVLAFSPRSESFKLKDFRGTSASRELAVAIDSTDSPFLVFSCTDGNLFVDAVSIKGRAVRPECVERLQAE